MRRGWRHGGPEGRRRRRRDDSGEEPWPGQGVAAAAARRRAAVGLLPRPSLSSHLRGRALISFFK